MASVPKLRILAWMGGSKRNYSEFPAPVQDSFGFELYLAQTGQHPPSAKPLRGLGSGVIELIEDYDGDTYRAIYTTRFEKMLYVLHAFKKKSKRGIKTPASDIELVKRRVRAASCDYAERFKEKKT